MCRCFSAHVAAFYGARALDLAIGSDVPAYETAWRLNWYWHRRATNGVRAGSWI